MKAIIMYIKYEEIKQQLSQSSTGMLRNLEVQWLK